ncbi:unnamed protein product [Hermetia illucens]|uniref:Pro-corazonin n=1 Tax=Hermetia illucens TaxID=343691 RepID=A0A7R8Z1Q2_HERIL|nr:pro-corazonin [Hermetia illucens]CAD7089956.1 unnamed protein product [Hermetia illucens]
MTKTAIIPIMILAMVVCCMGQTFQYSRGWTNGKRSDTHADESTELMIDADWEKKLEKCLYTLQRITQFPYMRNMLLTANRKYTGHHQIPIEDGDEISGQGLYGTRLKRRVNSMPA